MYRLRRQRTRLPISKRLSTIGRTLMKRLPRNTTQKNGLESQNTTQKPKTLPRKQVSEIAQSIIDAIAADPKITRRALAAQLGFPEIPSFQLAIFTNSRCLRRSTVPQQPLVGMGKRCSKITYRKTILFIIPQLSQNQHERYNNSQTNFLIMQISGVLNFLIMQFLGVSNFLIMQIPAG